MVLEKLSEWPSQKALKILIISGIIIGIFFLVLMNYYYDLSNYPVLFIESQLSFSGAVIKSHFRTMNAEELYYYLIWTLLDYGYMVGYGTLYFSLSLFVARKFEDNSGWRKTGYFAAVFGIAGALCDATENFFIVLMISDPRGFPDIWAVTHSCFALVKFILIITMFIWIIVAAIIYLIKRKSS
ncbi:MAG: hypothetical protein EU539_04145 [Promethearchaeota archaeon]|nr:MAG: hypothetical protein EU539_04145 [Candidatus Lokiarchaeota archaeon]